MAQGSPTIGFGRRGSLDYPSGSGQGAGGPRQSLGRNLCFNPSFGTGIDGYYPDFSNLGFPPDLVNIACRVATPTGIRSWDHPLTGTQALLVGGVAYNQDSTLTFETGIVYLSSIANVAAFTGAVIQGSGAHSGTNCLKVTATAAAVTTVGTTGTLGSPNTAIKAWANRTYNVSAWVKANTTGRSVAITINYYDATYTLISNVVGTPLTDSTSWQQISAQGVAPGGVHHLTYTISWTTPAAGEIHFLDDIRVYDVGALAFGGPDTSEDSYATYFFYAKPNTTYTFSGYLRHAPDTPFSATSPPVVTTASSFTALSTNSYALRLSDPNDVVDFGNGTTYDQTISIGTTLSGNEYYTWVRHALTYTTGAVVTAPLQLRLYGNKVQEACVQSANLSGITDLGTALDWASFYWSALNYNTFTNEFYDLNTNVIGSYWDGIQIEEASAASSYIDGAQRGCRWWEATDNARANANCTPSAGSTTDWTVNASISPGTVSNVTLAAVDRWFVAVNTDLRTGQLGVDDTTPESGSYAISLVTATNISRTRSALVFDYQGSGGYPHVTLIPAGYEGYVTAYVRADSTAYNIPAYNVVMALEDAGGTNLLASTSIAWNHVYATKWRRYALKISNPGLTTLDLSTTRLVFRQNDPTQNFGFQVAGVQFDLAPIATDATSNGGFSADYVASWAPDHEGWTAYKWEPGEIQLSQFSYYNLKSHRAVRVDLGEQDASSVGIPSFSGRVESSTISLSVIARSVLDSCSARNLRDLRFAPDLYIGRATNAGSPARKGSQYITFFGDPNLNGSSYGYGLQNAAMYARVVPSGSFHWYHGGLHSADPNDPGGTGVETMRLTSSGLTVPPMAIGQSEVATAENTASVTHVGLTTTDEVNITVPPSGMCVILWSAWAQNTVSGTRCVVGIEVFDGTSTILAAADDNSANLITAGVGTSDQMSSVYHVNAVVGRNLRIRLKYRVGSGTGTFSRRHLYALPWL